MARFQLIGASPVYPRILVMRPRRTLFARAPAFAPGPSCCRAPVQARDEQAKCRYSIILLTTPEPTVRPPSRIAKRSFFFHCDRCDQFNRKLQVVPRHHHFGAAGQFNRAGHIRGAKVKTAAGSS